MNNNESKQPKNEAGGGLSASPCSASSIFQYVDYGGRPIININGWSQIDYPVQKRAPIIFWLISLLMKRVDKIRRRSHLRPTPLPT